MNIFRKKIRYTKWNVQADFLMTLGRLDLYKGKSAYWIEPDVN